MTPKEKAEELVIKFMKHSFHQGSLSQCRDHAKQCALIAVDEIIINQPRYPSNVDWDDCGATHKYYYEEQRVEAQKYWENVKSEIEKL